MKVERPWHAKAREMRAEGATIREIAAHCGVGCDSVMRLVNPDYGRRRDAAQRQRLLRRLDADPVFRQRHKDQQRARSKLNRIRADARAEAAETGRPVEELYAAWGVQHVR